MHCVSTVRNHSSVHIRNLCTFARFLKMSYEKADSCYSIVSYESVGTGATDCLAEI